ncbi:ArnT family glycosyltransferase [Cesiribacter andamanensis]|uniref:Uncharacterized protein n=1 Tax=Cesiribacter andamanensis AMV16 TaxID=1279009 RepID=M7NAS0_9BACT|nr:glycosyltransferase family 39 protein [Cesiribacter andamanensis]EMR04261.1 hypothetical protein ADICEAN_00547 [Cesiribacter andamanensis AMV16]
MVESTAPRSDVYDSHPRSIRSYNSTIPAKAWYWGFGLWLFVLIYCYGHAFKSSAVNEDAGYYLSVARDLYEGEMLFRDVATHYTPLAYALLAPSFLVDKYGAQLVVFYLILLLSAYLIYKFLQLVAGSGKASYFGSFFYLFAAFALGGYQSLLEPLVNVWAISGLYLIFHMRKRFSIWFLVGAGVCTALSFLSKQFGLMIIIPVALAILLPGENYQKSVKQRVKMLIVYGLAAFLPIAAGLLVVRSMEVDLVIILTQWSGGGYGDHSLFQYLKAELWFLLKTAPFLLLMIVGKTAFRTHTSSILVLLLALLAFSLPLYFKTYPHYFLLQLPYISMLAGLLLLVGIESRTKRGLPKLVYLLMFILPLGYYTYRAVATTLHIYGQDRSAQLKVATKVKSAVGSSNTLVLDHYYLYYLANLEPPLKSEMGYSYLNSYEHKPSTLQELLNQADFLVVSDATVKGNAQIMSYIHHQSQKIIQLEPGLSLYQKVDAPTAKKQDSTAQE